MKRIIKVLTACALMGMLLASTASPAFAAPEWKWYYPKWGYGAQTGDQGDCNGVYGVPGCGWAVGKQQ